MSIRSGNETGQIPSLLCGDGIPREQAIGSGSSGDACSVHMRPTPRITARELERSRRRALCELTNDRADADVVLRDEHTDHGGEELRSRT